VKLVPRKGNTPPLICQVEDRMDERDCSNRNSIYLSFSNISQDTHLNPLLVVHQRRSSDFENSIVAIYRMYALFHNPVAVFILDTQRRNLTFGFQLCNDHISSNVQDFDCIS
jgi:hypothetical protein